MNSAFTEQSYRQRVARAVAAILADPLAAHCLDDLAALAHFSPFHFHRIYRGITGETVAATVRRVRLAHAAQRLGAGKSSVTQVGMDVGYESPQAFSRAFQQFIGLAPRDFQKKVGMITMNQSNDNGPHFNVEIVERDGFRVQGLRHRGPASTIPHTYQQLVAYVGQQQTGLWYGVMLGDVDDSVNEGCLYYATVSDAGESLLHADMEWLDIPGGRHALYTLKGPYTQINAVLTALYSSWLPQSGYLPDDRPTLERYLNSPVDAAPQDLLTELLIPIRDFTE